MKLLGLWWHILHISWPRPYWSDNPSIDWGCHKTHKQQYYNNVFHHVANLQIIFETTKMFTTRITSFTLSCFGHLQKHLSWIFALFSIILHLRSNMTWSFSRGFQQIIWVSFGFIALPFITTTITTYGRNSNTFIDLRFGADIDARRYCHHYFQVAQATCGIGLHCRRFHRKPTLCVPAIGGQRGHNRVLGSDWHHCFAVLLRFGI